MDYRGEIETTKKIKTVKKKRGAGEGGGRRTTGNVRAEKSTKGDRRISGEGGVSFAN